MTIAATILQQLGGNKFLAMTGAKNLLAHEAALSFRLTGPTLNKANYVRITLSPRDTYDIEFLSLRGFKSTVKGSLTDIYAEQLRDVFTSATGLQTSLGTMGGR